jgi:hypothetical protein
MGLLEKSLRVVSTHRASTPGLIRALVTLEQEGQNEALQEIKIVLPPHIKRKLQRRRLM